MILFRVFLESQSSLLVIKFTTVGLIMLLVSIIFSPQQSCHHERMIYCPKQCHKQGQTKNSECNRLNAITTLCILQTRTLYDTLANSEDSDVLLQKASFHFDKPNHFSGTEVHLHLESINMLSLDVYSETVR